MGKRDKGREERDGINQVKGISHSTLILRDSMNNSSAFPLDSLLFLQVLTVSTRWYTFCTFLFDRGSV